MEFLYTGVYLCANMFHFYVYLCLFRIFLGKAKEKWIEWLGFSLFFIINSATFLIAANPYLNLISTIVPSIIISFFYEAGVPTKIFVSIMTVTASMILDSVIFNVGTMFFFQTLTINELFANVTGNFLLFLFAQIIKKVRAPQKNTTLFLSHWFIIVAAPISSIGIITMIFQMGYSSQATIVILAILMGLNVGFFWLFDKMTEYYQMQSEKEVLVEQLRAYKQHIKLISENQQKIKELRHDIKNHFSYLSAFLKNADVEGASAYLQKISGYISNPMVFVDSGNQTLDSFLNYKIGEISRLLVNISLDIRLPQQIPYGDFDLCMVLGNLLDNSYEALYHQTVGETKRFSLKMHYERGMLYIKITNTYSGSLRKVMKDKEQIYLTTKRDTSQHGNGLSHVKKMVQRYGGEVKINDSNHLYCVELLLYENSFL